MNSTITTKRHTSNSKGLMAFAGIFQDEITYIDDTNEIRAGVNRAEEDVKKESARRRINAPLTIEEKIFFTRRHI